MSLAGFALRYRAVIVSMVVVMMLAGSMSYMSMPRREDPEYVVRTCQVQTNWPGTPTEKVEELITDPLEDEINTLDGIRWVRSETVMGRSSVFVELDRPTPGDEVVQMWDKVRSRVERVPMPDPSIVPLVIDDFGDTNIMLMAMYQLPLEGDDEVRPENRYTPRELDIFSDRLKDELKLIQGVAKVDRASVQEEAIYIETDLGAWSQLNLSTNELEFLISRRNVIAPGGDIDTDVGRFSVKPSGDIDAVEELSSIVVGAVGDDDARAPVYLHDIGLKVVRDYVDPPLTMSRYSDAGTTQPCVMVAFTMKQGSNIVDVCESAKALCDRLRETEKIFPPDLGIAFISDQSENVVRKIDDFIMNVLGAVLIVVIVVYLMVGFRSAAVMAANIPLVIIGTLAIIPLFDIQMEQISLAAMIIALGMLVDNAVQICDQTRRLQTEGKTPFFAALDGANELAFPILIATGTTIAAFYPMVIGLQGATNEYVRSLPITLTVTLALSYVMAMTFCVLLAYWFIRAPTDPNESLSPVIQLFNRFRKNKPAPDAPPGFLSQLYPNLSRACLKGRWFVLAISFALLIGTFMLPVGSEFFPQDIRDQFAIEVWLPEGAAIHQTDEAAAKVEHIVRTLSPSTDIEGNPVERLRGMASRVGAGHSRWYLGRNPESPKPNYAEIVVRTSDGAFTGDYASAVRRIAREGDAELGLEPVLGARVIPRQLVMGPVVDAPIGLRVYGPGFADLPLLHEQADKLKDLLRVQPGTWDVYDAWGSDGYQFSIDVDEDKANLAGVTNKSLAQSLNAYFSGHYITTFREGDHQVPVYLRLPPEQRGSLDAIRHAYVEGLNGKVPLDSVASFGPRFDPGRIDRRYLNRVIECRARVEPGVRANDIVTTMMASPEFAQWEDELPPGFTWEVGGELFESQQAGGELSLALTISILAIILLLIIQYNGVSKPIIILTTLPLALIGALGGLWITDNALGFMPQLGILSLFGIVVNTAIIFIEFADNLIKEKVLACDGSGPIMGLTVTEFRECLVKAGQVRLLPIAMTTLTTIGGLLPLALAGGPLWEGMSWLMIFGLIVATLLTLVIVPALYAIFVENFGMKPVQLEPTQS